MRPEDLTVEVIAESGIEGESIAVKRNHWNLFCDPPLDVRSSAQ
jgi:hypothetical protein